MNKSDFFSNLINYSKREGFSFFVPGEHFDDPKRLSEGKQITYRTAFVISSAIAASLAGLNYRFFIIGGLSPSKMNPAEKEALVADLQMAQSYCDYIGIKTSNGPAVLRLGIDADDIPDESLIGRFAVIHEQAHKFRNHSSLLFGSRLYGKNTFAVYAQVVIVFSSHKRAKDFIQNVADKCSHAAFWKKIYTYPWIVDLEDEEIKRYRAPLDSLFGQGEKLKSELFQKLV